MNDEFLCLTKQALGESNCIFGSNFVYKGATYQGIINDGERHTELEGGGFIEVYRTRIVVPNWILNVAPVPGEKININGKMVQVDFVSSDEISFEIHCKSAAN